MKLACYVAIRIIEVDCVIVIPRHANSNYRMLYLSISGVPESAYISGVPDSALLHS